MANIDYKEKLLGVLQNETGKNIVITHVTIRQSISFLVLRLLSIEIMAAIAIIVFHTLILRSDIRQLVGDDILIFNIPLFILLVVIKTVITIFVIIQWLNEYYEITTKDIVHRRGLILKKEERHLLQHIGSVSIEQGVFGRIFNFGTLKLFNWTKEKYVYLYLIHNPMKYLHIMEELLPDADKSKRTVREHILEPEEDSL
jgi:membrane protein YdbS with pleckstrin-like domain